MVRFLIVFGLAAFLLAATGFSVTGDESISAAGAAEPDSADPVGIFENHGDEIGRAHV
jgi:hypothetical protein